MTVPPPEPPRPPRIPPRLRFRRGELVGIAVIALLPLAAVAGLFGPSSSLIEGRLGSIEVDVRYPTRLRYEMSDRIEIILKNEGREAVTGASLSIDPAYLEAFSDVSFTPEVDRPFLANLADLRPGEEQRVIIEVHADGYGSHRGHVTLAAGGASTSLPLHSLIFP